MCTAGGRQRIKHCLTLGGKRHSDAGSSVAQHGRGSGRVLRRTHQHLGMIGSTRETTRDFLLDLSRRATCDSYRADERHEDIAARIDDLSWQWRFPRSRLNRRCTVTRHVGTEQRCWRSFPDDHFDHIATTKYLIPPDVPRRERVCKTDSGFPRLQLRRHACIQIDQLDSMTREFARRRLNLPGIRSGGWHNGTSRYSECTNHKHSRAN